MPAMPRDLPTPPPERLFLPGPVGRLAATWERPAAPPRGLVLHLHPHPEHGGTRRNNVVRHGALGALEAGCGALRIDFRGVGRSEGSYDQGVGEVEDGAAALTWLRIRHPGLPVFVWGFSFGAMVGLKLAARQAASCAGFLAVAWPTRFYSWPDLPGPAWPRRSAFLAGDADEFVDLDRYEPVRARRARLEILPGADHFFRGRLAEVRRFTADTLTAWLREEGRATAG
ncbi:MAG: alpha/beta hydrolase [Planctomycetota bacterium]|nr:MAG: alpha/beta hydrolase [Planctomycetota bacterium]